MKRSSLAYFKFRGVSATAVTSTSGGTANILPKFTSGTNIGNSTISDTGTTINLGSANTQVTDATGKLPTIAGVATDTNGLTLPVPVATPTYSGATAAVTNFINYTPAAVNGTIYRLTVGVIVNSATTASFSVNVTFTTPAGNAVTVVMGGSSPLGTALSTGLITNVTGTGVYTFDALLFGVDNSGTAITVSTVGTFTTVNYTLISTLERLK